MKKSRIIGLVLTAGACIVLAIAGTRLGQNSSCAIEDAEGNSLATVSIKQGEYVLDCGEDDWAYADLAFHEASGILAEEKQLTREEAEQELVRSGVTVRTYYQKEIQEDLTEAMNTSGEVALSDSAGAVSDTEGRLLACRSFSVNQNGRNYVTYPTWAGSTMKPLCVYGPALEENKICWSSMEEDSPCMQVKNEAGELADWPVNTVEYTYSMKTMAQALKESNNAIAVKTLKNLGVADALDWMQERFHYTVDEERRRLEEEGEDQILGNVALGYLEAGVTVEQMLENYQVFVSGGMRRTLRAVDYIEDKDGVRRTEPDMPQQIFSEDTAYIVNRMLKGVVENGGTGEAAALEGVDLCGKTGTSSDYRDNWFIGITPQYLCCVWYNCETEEAHAGNEAVAVCREVISRLPDQTGLEFVCPAEVEEIAYCTRTGLRAGEYCAETAVGYYKKGSFTQECNCQPVLTIKK
ncbi:MAG: penicillin-binding transpeptidase domain-containing protein [Lachnospiraceae bacterium]|nr:penicillin-binding transpeptidase domain-containing protein [Lachnospiraceae bacterium]